MAAFDRYEEQCVYCTSFITNVDVETRKLMVACQIECSCDKYCRHDRPCDTFIPVTEK